MPVEIGPRGSTLYGFLSGNPRTARELYALSVSIVAEDDGTFEGLERAGAENVEEFRRAVVEMVERGEDEVRRQLIRLERLGLVTRAAVGGGRSDLWWRL